MLTILVTVQAPVQHFTVAGPSDYCWVHWVPTIQVQAGDRVTELVTSRGMEFKRHKWVQDTASREHQRTPWPVDGPGAYRYKVWVNGQKQTEWKVTTEDLCVSIFRDGFESGDLTEWSSSG